MVALARAVGVVSEPPRGAFLGVEVEVTFAAKPGPPSAFVRGAETIPITRVLSSWTDTGWGGLPTKARRWWLKRRRDYYLVETPQGVFELYHDRGEKRERWMLVRRVEGMP